MENRGPLSRGVALLNLISDAYDIGWNLLRADEGLVTQNPNNLPGLSPACHNIAYDVMREIAEYINFDIRICLVIVVPKHHLLCLIAHSRVLLILERRILPSMIRLHMRTPGLPLFLVDDRRQVDYRSCTAHILKFLCSDMCGRYQRRSEKWRIAEAFGVGNAVQQCDSSV